MTEQNPRIRFVDAALGLRPGSGRRDVNSLAPKAEAPSRAPKIVIAEDEVLLRLMLADVLREQGFQVFEAADAEEAIAILKCTPDVDVVVSDMRMRATLDGLSLASYVRAHCPDVSLVLASAYVQLPLDPTFDAIFMKPFSPEEIAKWIRKRLRYEAKDGSGPPEVESA
jgi:CheY-like chemotaxis protein